MRDTDRIARVAGLWGVACLALLLAACIVKETTHTWYLEPDGSVTWRILEEDARSDEEDAGDRRDEEAEFLRQARLGTSTNVEVLAGLGALWVDVRLLREVRPYSVLTEAQFPSLEGLVEEILFRLERDVWSEMELVTVGGESRLTLVLAEAEELVEPLGEEDDLAEKLGDVLLEMSELRIVLVEGRFTDARGFVIEGDGGLARPIEPVAEEELERLELCLAWSGAAEADAPSLFCEGSTHRPDAD